MSENIKDKIDNGLLSAADELAGYAAACETNNTEDYMQGLVEYLNKYFIAANTTKRCKLGKYNIILSREGDNV